MDKMERLQHKAHFWPEDFTVDTIFTLKNAPKEKMEIISLLPAADNWDGDEGDDEDDSCCRRACNQGELLPQLRLEIICRWE